MKYFRLSREVALILIEQLEPLLPQPRRDEAIPNFKKILMLLFHFAHGTYQTPAGISAVISMSQSSVSRALHEVLPVFIQSITPTYIKFPQTSAEAQRFSIPVFPGVFGLLDGTHIEIVTPANSIEQPSRLYRNRKGTTSLNVMAAVTVDHRYLSVNARFPGSVHDSAVWQLSQTRAHIVENYMAGRPIGILLADRGYPCEPWLLTPIENARSNSAQAYNRALTQHRKEIELTFGETKNCWRCLLRHRVMHYAPEVAAMIIVCCMTLHNIRLMYNVNSIELNESEASEESDLEEDPQPPPDNHRHHQESSWLRTGRISRDNYIQRHFQ